MSPRIALLGKQGAGKGTQARRLGAYYRVPHISTGDTFRAAATAGTPFGLRAAEYMDRGELVPDDVVIAAVTERLARDEASGGFVLDGFPRTRQQAEELHRVLVPASLDAAVDIDVATPLVMKRLSGRRVCRRCGAIYHVDQPPSRNWTCDTDGGAVVQRPDDDEPAVLRRLQLYEQEIQPVMSYYAGLGILGVVSGVGTVEEVSDRIIGFIDDAVDARRATHPSGARPAEPTGREVP
jgi:adenylate kinase